MFFGSRLNWIWAITSFLVLILRTGAGNSICVVSREILSTLKSSQIGCRQQSLLL